MDRFANIVHLIVTLGAIAVATAFVSGAIIAPLVILARGACWWRRRLKWATVALFTSWFGLWLFQREQTRSGAAAAPAGSATRAT